MKARFATVLIFIATSVMLLQCARPSARVGNEEIVRTDVDTAGFETIISDYVESNDSLPELDFAGDLEPGMASDDLHMLKWVLEEGQTAIYRYARKEEVDRAFAEALKRTREPISYLELVRLIVGIQNTIACGHSGWGHTESFRSYRNREMKFLPVDVDVREGRIYVLRDNSLAGKLEEGDVILGINGEPMDQVNDRLRGYMNRDGKSGRHSIEANAPYFSNAYSNFITNPDTFHLRIGKQQSGKEIVVALEALPRSEIELLRKKRYPGNDGPGLKVPLHLSIEPETNIAIYTIRSFNNNYITHFGQDFCAFTDSVFGELAGQKIGHLVIDLRGNTGGWTANGAYLFSHFISKPMAYMRRVLVRKHKDFSFAELVTSEPGYLDTFDLRQNAAGLYEWTNYPSLTVTPADRNRFSGQCYILIDNMSRSCSAMFSSMMQAHTDAKFIGEETGTAQCGSNGMVMAIELPRTRIPIHFSTAQYELNVPDPKDSRGIIPDLQVPSDSAMEFALRQIAGTSMKK